MGTIDFGIITIREDEFRAVLERVGNGWQPRHGRQRIYNECVVTGGTQRTVAVVRCLEQGNTEAQNAARDMIDELKPSWLFVVGIAGGVADDDFSLGDVVVSTRIHDVSVEAVSSDAREYALAGGPLDPEITKVIANIPAMDQALRGWDEIGLPRPGVPRRYYGDKEFKERVRASIQRHFGKDAPERGPIVTTGAIASSDRLVKNAELIQVWQRVARQVRAIEMESAGVYRAAHGRTPFVAIRGISDIVGLKRNAKWTAYACHSAAAFTAALIKAWPLPSRRDTEPPDPPRQRAGSAMSRLALMLDRDHQWGKLKELCVSSDKPVALVVHGDAGQDVHLFCERIQRRLHIECRQRIHETFRLPLRHEYSTARTAEDWEDRMRAELGVGDLADALTRATREQPIMLILGNGPLRDLDIEETRALSTFLGDRLPALIARARCAHPVRVLVPIEHQGHSDGLEDPLVLAMHDALQRAAGAGFQTELLIEITYPTWAEVSAHIIGELFETDPLDTDFLARCRNTYTQLNTLPPGERSFAALVNALNELFEERALTLRTRR